MTALDVQAVHNGAPLFVHRKNRGRSYRGLPINAPPGVHEFVTGWLDVNRPHHVPVLEVGADTGALTARLMDRGFEVVPVDVRASPFTGCCPTFVEVEFNDPHWTAGLPEPAFETIVALDVIGRLENPRKLIRDLFAVTAPGGDVLVSTPNVLCASSLMGLIRQGMFHGFNGAAHEAREQISILPYWLIEKFAGEAGFAQTEVMLIGDLERPWLKKAFLRAADRTLRRIRQEPDPVSSYGSVVLVRLMKA